MTRISQLAKGSITPLGSSYDGQGVNFALFSAHAEKVELCIFSHDGSQELKRFLLSKSANQIWSGYLSDATPGTVYGYRVYGAYQPQMGHRFNHHKLLMDPYAKNMIGKFIPSDLHYAYKLDSEDSDLSFDSRDNAAYVPKSVVVANSPNFIIERSDQFKTHTIIYEAHVKGFTKLHPSLPAKEQGTFKGLGHEAIIAYLKDLGITCLELLPIQGFVDEAFLAKKGLSNYWGYNTLTFFAPHQAYLSGNSINECREMVDRLHEAGIDVVLDLVFNHTAEGGRLGPTFNFKGIDNLSYYRLQSTNKRYYINDTGCGNTLNLSHPQVIRMVMDCLRYWVLTMHVDGFRFDLATVLGRESGGYDKGSGFFDALNQDPTLQSIRLIAEPWDVGPGGYQLGNFPIGWSEWNDHYRDTVRKFWRGDAGILPDLARRIHGSSDIFEHSGRSPAASINFITSHDGFTLNDLVSYKERHNELNLEENKDGHGGNFSDNYGVEGPTFIDEINAIRLRQRKNFLVTLFISQGIPMLTAGDELGRSLAGNNNAYCQDNKGNWLNWLDINQTDQELLEFTRYVLALRKSYPELIQNKYVHESGNINAPVIRWFGADGNLMQDGHWAEHNCKTLGYYISAFNDKSSCQRFYCILNADKISIEITLPTVNSVANWKLLLDTGLTTGIPGSEAAEITKGFVMGPYSVIILLADAISTETFEEQLL